MKILRVDLSTRQASKEEVPQYYQDLGGRALIAEILSREVNPRCDALGSENLLIFAPGLLAGTSIPCSGRISIGGKSPLTGGVKEANSGGNIAHYLARMGVKALIIGKKPSDERKYILHVEEAEVKFIPADEFVNKGVFETAELLKERFGKNIQASIIGPAGEKMQLAAGIANFDNEGRPSRYSARGGLGALMGSKGIKAIVFAAPKLKSVQPLRQEKYKETLKKYVELIMTSPATGQSYPKYGTSAAVDIVNTLQGLPTRNFSEGEFEGAAKINASALYDLIVSRGGEGSTTHNCMSGCIIKCSNVVPGPDGKEIVSPLEFETIGLLGSNLAIDSLDDIARMNWLCNDLGLDTLEVGASIGILMEQGVLPFGDAKGAIHIVEQAGEGSILGKLVASGAEITGKVFGSRHVPTVRGQAMPAYEPRAIKGFGVTYITSAMGADHTTGPTHRMNVDHRKGSGQAEASKNSQVGCGVCDLLGLCLFVGSGIGPNRQVLVDLLNSVVDKDYTVDDLNGMVKKFLARESDYNELAGLPRIARLPEYMYLEPNKTTGTVFDVPMEELEKNFL
jgi:aldehyde:ferredoxin oxidoreductase